MANFVLVAGARLGAWAWADVVPHLEAVGHGVHPLTLSGLADKHGVPAGQQTHVQDIVDAVDSADLRDVVLVGHSYAGVPVGQAAERIGNRPARVIFVDASLSADGEAFASGGPDGGAAMRAAIAANDGFWPVAAPAHYGGHGLTDEQVARIVAGSTPHPGATLTEPAVLTRPLSALPATYIHCLLPDGKLETAWAGLLASYGWRLVEMTTGHWPMFSQPRELSQLLLETAGE
ncbi:esterase [Paractinoplanes abujensis]|uniref:Pimeloyl-ACP methyl ester carboxylesterase n=1 Tax=Paractinoplanes abujensis TaxID=882441 RepID=A0A7W7CSW2_9ACTN|nr:alpha/beta fold hydrolase [Actinoplanes abujensis]MBB4692673.1 pimeloyl-ACP methyl ester carboxylesterase [Actinoplanes abujensis]GID22826.1 esterase [Actinoplanes abujensis]